MRQIEIPKSHSENKLIMMKEKNRAVLEDTLKTCENGYYSLPSGNVKLKLDKNRMTAAQVYEPWQIEELRKEKWLNPLGAGSKCSFSVDNTDSFSLARRLSEENPEDKVLVLNLANATHIGGGARHGAKAQEEDLCRQSTLLIALEGEDAARYYAYNNSHYSRMGSDAIIMIPEVEILKDADYNYLNHTTVVSVITCAAPIIDPGKYIDPVKYRKLMYHRIEGILVASAFHGYRRLVLGAFGCGAFNNDAAVVSDIFRDVVRDFRLNDMGVDRFFKSIDFAVLTGPGRTYNFDEFQRNFEDNERKPKKMKISHPELIGFWHEYEDYGCLSNWYKADFEYAGRSFSSVEQFMMYHKLLTFHQFELADKVMDTDDPAEAKKLGRTHFDNFDDKLWTRISPTIVKRGVRAKFEQNPQLLEVLLSTGNAVLAECSPYDKVWGIGLAPDDKRIIDTTQWAGKNKLGRILMILREEFRNRLADPMTDQIEYVDADTVAVIPEWEMNTGLLKMVPQYHDAIDAYGATLKDLEISAFYQMTFSELEIDMRINMGGGMPVIGFYEMKQEIFDIARRLSSWNKEKK